MEIYVYTVRTGSSGKSSLGSHQYTLLFCPNLCYSSVCEKEVYFTGDSARIPKFEPPLVVERGALPSPQNAKTESTRENGTIAKNNLDNHVPEPALARQSAVPPSEHYNLAEIRHFDRVSTIGLFEDFISRKPPAPVDIQNVGSLRFLPLQSFTNLKIATGA